jgi:hypothetical protein
MVNSRCQTEIDLNESVRGFRFQSSILACLESRFSEQFLALFNPDLRFGLSTNTKLVHSLLVSGTNHHEMTAIPTSLVSMFRGLDFFDKSASLHDPPCPDQVVVCTLCYPLNTCSMHNRGLAQIS